MAVIRDLCTVDGDGRDVKSWRPGKALIMIADKKQESWFVTTLYLNVLMHCDMRRGGRGDRVPFRRA